MEADKDGDGKLSFDEFKDMVSNTVCPMYYVQFCFLIGDHRTL
jgi:hypothetical protein